MTRRSQKESVKARKKRIKKWLIERRKKKKKEKSEEWKKALQKRKDDVRKWRGKLMKAGEVGLRRERETKVGG